MEGKADSDRIRYEWFVDEVLQRYPSTAAVFLQYGPVYEQNLAGFSQIIPLWLSKNMLIWEE